MIRLLVALFVLSGFAGLVYESIWSRYLGLFVGHSAYAQVIVLVIFLGGMSLGALAVARRSERIARPLLAYAWIEALVGLMGLAFHPVFIAVTGAAYSSWFPALGESPALVAVKWSLAGLLILPQSILLGATFPLMSAGILRLSGRTPGRTLALLYFANSLGAAVGALVSGLWLVDVLGLPGTVAVAGVINLVVAGAVVAAVRGHGPEPGPAPSPPPPAPAPAAPPARGRAPRRPPTPAPVPYRLLLLVSFGTAVASFIYEIAWIRMLSLVLGSTSRSFEVMLSAFILGLALGALWVRSRADHFRSPVRALGLLQVFMGSLAMATIPVYLTSFYWMSALVGALPQDLSGYRIFSLVRYVICLAVMLPATFCAGTTLPLITRALMGGGRGGRDERAIGLVYGVNTLGAILGAGLAALVMLPWLGLKGLLLAGAAVDIALGIVLLARGGDAPTARRLAPVAAVATLALLISVALFARFELRLLTSGVYRSGLLPHAVSVKVVSYHDGRTASVSVEHYQESDSYSLSTNGKADASLRRLWLKPEAERPAAVLRTDETTQIFSGLIPLAHMPSARTAAVVGLGSGITSHHLLGSPHLERVTTIEIEPEIVRAARWFSPANRRVFEDPRHRFVIDDAKSFFASGRERYDLIISEPSNVWVSGVAGLFSTEFYQRVRGHLSPEGVFGQWIHLYESNDDLVLSVLAAVHRNFRSYETFLVDDSDLLIVATDRASGLTPDWGVVDLPGIAADLRNIPRLTPEILEALRTCDRGTLAPLVEKAEPNSDFYPILDRGSERARFFAGSARGFTQLHADRFSIARLLTGRRVGPLESFVVPAPEIHRLRQLAMSAALRGASRDLDPARIHPELPAMMARRSELARVLASPTPPADWRAWTVASLVAEQEWHAGTLGRVDEGFHRLLREFAARHQAPPQVHAALGFIHDMALMDTAGAIRNARPLIEAAAAGDFWLPPDLLFDGAVTMYLVASDSSAARSAYQRLLPRLVRDPHDLRTRLLAAHLHL